MKKLLQLVVLLLLVAAGAGTSYITRPTTPEAYAARYAEDETPTASLLRDLPGIIRDHDLPFSVALVASAVETGVIENNGCHTLLHLIGHEAYQILGDDFPAIFEANRGQLCLGGYLHGVEAQIAQDNPDDPAPLFAFCEEVKERGVGNGPCFHGVGHSAFEYSQDMHESLARCDALAGGPEENLWNCYRGVFSELGNALLGVDTNTEQAIEPLVLPGVSVKEPFTLCDSLGERFHDSCVSQLSKLFFMGDDLAGSFGRCVANSRTSRAAELCVSVLAGVAARNEFERGDVTSLATGIASLPRTLWEDALLGAREGYVSYARDHQENRPFEGLCALLSGEIEINCRRESLTL